MIIADDGPDAVDIQTLVAGLLKELPGQVPVVVITGWQDPERVARALQTGVEGYLDINMEPELLCASLEVALSGDTTAFGHYPNGGSSTLMISAPRSTRYRAGKVQRTSAQDR